MRAHRTRQTVTKDMYNLLHIIIAFSLARGVARLLSVSASEWSAVQEHVQAVFLWSLDLCGVRGVQEDQALLVQATVPRRVRRGYSK